MQSDRSNVGILIGGVLLIAFGLIMGADPLLRALQWEFSWPLILTGIAVLLFIGMLLGKKHAAWLAIPACIFGCIGLGTYIYDLTHHWKMMFYFWTLLLWFAGAGLYLMGWKLGNVKQKQSALHVMKVGLFLLMILGTFFEVLFSRFTAVAFPFLFVAAGVVVVLSYSGDFFSKKRLPSKVVTSTNPPGPHDRVPPISTP